MPLHERHRPEVDLDDVKDDRRETALEASVGINESFVAQLADIHDRIESIVKKLGSNKPELTGGDTKDKERSKTLLKRLDDSQQSISYQMGQIRAELHELEQLI